MTQPIPLAFAMDEGLLERLFTPAALDRLAEVASFELDELPADLRAAADRLSEVEVLVTGWGAPVLDAAALALMPKLRAVVHAAGSVKHHLPREFWTHGIPVSSAAWTNALPVAEYTLAAIIFANKGVLRLAAAYREDPGGIDLLEQFPDIGNHAKRVGIVGASRIGRRVIELLAPFSLEVAVFDPYLSDAEASELGVVSVSLDELVSTSGVVSLHAPALPSTRHMIDARRLAMMRDGATLINTARGGLVDHDALIEELRSGRLWAILDTTEPERLSADSPLLQLPNALLTPHAAGSLGTELTRLGDTAVDEVERIVAGEDLLHAVHADELDRTA